MACDPKFVQCGKPYLNSETVGKILGRSVHRIGFGYSLAISFAQENKTLRKPVQEITFDLRSVLVDQFLRSFVAATSKDTRKS